MKLLVIFVDIKDVWTQFIYYEAHRYSHTKGVRSFSTEIGGHNRERVERILNSGYPIYPRCPVPSLYFLNVYKAYNF